MLLLLLVLQDIVLGVLPDREILEINLASKMFL